MLLINLTLSPVAMAPQNLKLDEFENILDRLASETKGRRPKAFVGHRIRKFNNECKSSVPC